MAKADVGTELVEQFFDLPPGRMPWDAAGQGVGRLFREEQLEIEALMQDTQFLDATVVLLIMFRQIFAFGGEEWQHVLDALRTDAFHDPMGHLETAHARIAALNHGHAKALLTNYLQYMLSFGVRFDENQPPRFPRRLLATAPRLGGAKFSIILRDGRLTACKTEGACRFEDDWRELALAPELKVDSDVQQLIDAGRVSFVDLEEDTERQSPSVFSQLEDLAFLPNGALILRHRRPTQFVFCLMGPRIDVGTMRRVLAAARSLQTGFITTAPGRHSRPEPLRRLMNFDTIKQLQEKPSVGSLPGPSIQGMSRSALRRQLRNAMKSADELWQKSQLASERRRRTKCNDLRFHGRPKDENQRRYREHRQALADMVCQYQWAWFVHLLFTENLSASTVAQRFSAWAQELGELHGGDDYRWFMVIERGEKELPWLHVHAVVGGLTSGTRREAWKRKWQQTNGKATICRFQQSRGGIAYILKQSCPGDECSPNWHGIRKSGG